MMKNVKKAAPEFATSETYVWWDMNGCPVPNGYDPSRVGPRIDTELKNLGYNGPLTIIGIGNLEGVPLHFLKALSSGGVVIKQLQLGSSMVQAVVTALRSSESRFQPPLTMMVISAVHADILEDMVCEFYNLGSLYNLLLAYPPDTEHADPDPSSILVDNFGGEWVWDRFGLLRGSANNETRRQDTGCELHFCGLCNLSFPTFDDFATHFKTLPQHADKMDEYLTYRAWKFNRAAQLTEERKLGETFLAKLDKKRQAFVEYANVFNDDSDDDDPKIEKSKSLKKPKLMQSGKKFKFGLLCKSSLKKRPSSNANKLSKLSKATKKLSKLEIA